MSYREILLMVLVLLLLSGTDKAFTTELMQDVESPTLIISATWNTTGDTLLVIGRAGTGQYQWGIWLYNQDLQLVRMFPTEDRVSAEWSPDGTRLSMGRNILDVQTLEILLTIDANSGIGGWSPDSTQVLAWTEDHLLGLFDSRTGDLVRTISVGDMFPDAVSWSPNGDYFALIQPTGETDIISAEDGRHLTMATPLEDSRGLRYPMSLRWSPNSQYFAASFTENVEPGTPGTLPNSASPRVASVIIWDVLTGEIIHKFSDFQAVIQPLRWNPHRPEELAGGTSSGLVYLWNIETGQEITTFHTLPSLTSMEYSPFGGRLIVGSWLDRQSWYDISVQESRFSQTVVHNVLEVFIPIPSLERLQSIAESCNAPIAIEQSLTASIQADRLTEFITQVEALPDDIIPSACRADLLAVAEALQAGE